MFITQFAFYKIIIIEMLVREIEIVVTRFSDQPVRSSEPHSGQAFAPGGTSAPQLGQTSAISLFSKNVRDYVVDGSLAGTAHRAVRACKAGASVLAALPSVTQHSVPTYIASVTAIIPQKCPK
jgi:hypothetical protein